MTSATAARPLALASSVAKTLSRAEHSLIAFLRDDVIAAFACAADDERRVDVYLTLNQVLRLEDTHGSVRVLQHFLPHILHVIYADLQRTTVRDLLHLALRTLSYFMHHPVLAAAIPDTQVEAFLSNLTSRLASTQDEVTYKLCLWCLTMQNFDLARLDYLPRIVEALVLAIINPFDSRPIAIEAIKGLHLLTCKFKSLMVAQRAILRIWFRPIVSRLASSDKTTRHHVALALLEAAAFFLDHAWEDDVHNEIMSALCEYALPAMRTHVTHERYHDALTVWNVVLLLLRRTLPRNVELLNELLSIAEPLMRHTDASVRLQSLDGWRYVVAVFRTNPEWVFDRPVIVLLVRPILSCLETETAVNVLHAAISTWRVIVGATVEDFNAFCKAQGRTVEAIQQSAKKIKYKRWFDDVVRKVIGVAMEQERTQATREDSVSHTAVHDMIQTTVRELFSTAVVVRPSESEARTLNTRNPGSSIGSSTTAASSVSEPQTHDQLQSSMSDMDLSERDDQLLDAELLQHSRASASLSSLGEPAPPVVPACPPLSGLLLALAIILPDVLKTVERLGQVRDGSEQARLSQQLGLAIWNGFCTRLAESAIQDHVDAGVEKMRLRLVRFCLDFTFGISGSSSAASSSLDSQASVLMTPSHQSDGRTTAADLLHGLRPHRQSVQGFQWQLRLLHQIITLTSSTDEFVGLFQHTKSRISHHLLTLVDRIIETNDVYKEWLALWDQAAVKYSGDVGNRIDFAAKSATMLCVLLYLVLSLAVAFDSDAPTADGLLWDIVGVYGDVVRALVKCINLTTQSSELISKFCDVMLKSPMAAQAILERETQSDSMAERAGVGRLLRMCDRLTSRSEETEDNAEMLLHLQRSPVKPLSPPRTTSWSAADITSRETAQDLNSAVSTKSNAATSPCMLQAERNVFVAAEKPDVTEASSQPPPRPPAPPSAAACSGPPQTPNRPKKSAIKGASTPTRTASAPPTPTTSTSAAPPPNGPIFPDLVGNTEPIAQVYTYFPFSFRHIAPFYKIETVGHLAAMSVDQVKKMGVKDAAVTVRNALIEFQARRARLRLPPGINSPFRQRLQSPPVRTPALSSPSHKRVLKRPTDSPKLLPVTPLPFESPQPRKRARRSLLELSSDADGDGDGTTTSHGVDDSPSTSPSEQRVKFRLEMEGGASRITRPGSDSQDVVEAPREKEKETPQEKIQSLFDKMDQHLERSLHYAKKIAEEEESLQSLSASMGEETIKMTFLTSAIQHSTDIMAEINARLMLCTERRHERREHARGKDA